MSNFQLIRKNPTAGEVTSSLVNASDSAGLHFDGTSGYIDIASPPDLGTKFSFEFIVQADSWADSTYKILVGFGSAGRFIIGTEDTAGAKLAIFDNASWKSFGVAPLDDLKVHHLVFTIDGTAATLYDNGNQVGTATISASHNLDNCADAKIGSDFDGTSDAFNGTIYRCRFWNKTLSQTDVTSVYESASIDYADQWGSQTDLINATSSGSGTAWTGASGTTPPTGWTAGGTGRTFTIDSSSGSGAEPALKITAGSSNAFIKSNLTTSKAKRYVLEFIYKNTAGAVAQYSVDAASTLVDLANSTSWSSVQSVEFTGTGGNDLYLLAKSAGDIVWFDTVNIREIGCVSDFDFSYANPTQSTIIQNRSGSGDGTAAGGIYQINPTEQLNSKSARIGTSQAAPADGELLVSGKGYFGDEVKISHDDNVGLSIDNTGLNGQEWQIMNGVDSRTNLQFKVGVSGGAPSKLLMLLDGTNDRVGIGPSPASPAETLEVFGKLKSTNVIVSGMATSDPTVAGQLWNDSGTVKISAG